MINPPKNVIIPTHSNILTKIELGLEGSSNGFGAYVAVIPIAIPSIARIIPVIQRCDPSVSEPGEIMPVRYMDTDNVMMLTITAPMNFKMPVMGELCELMVKKPLIIII
jgi:hypothetical protein